MILREVLITSWLLLMWVLMLFYMIGVRVRREEKLSSYISSLLSSSQLYTFSIEIVRDFSVLIKFP